MKSIKLTLFAILSAYLTACSATPEECDPAVELSVFGKAACSFSGSYDKRIEQKEKILLDEKATSKELNSIYSQIKAQQNAVNQSAAQKKAQLAKLNKSVNSLTADLKKKAAGKSGLMKQINEVEQQLKNVNNSSASEAEKQLELQKLQSKLSSLQQAIGI